MRKVFILSDTFHFHVTQLKLFRNRRQDHWKHPVLFYAWHSRPLLPTTASNNLRSTTWFTIDFQVWTKQEKNSPVKGWGGLRKMSKNVKMSIHPTTHRWEWLHKSKIVKDNWIILIRLWFIWLLVIWHNSRCDSTHTYTYPPIPTNPYATPTHPPLHPATHPYTYPPTPTPTATYPPLPPSTPTQPPLHPPTHPYTTTTNPPLLTLTPTHLHTPLHLSTYTHPPLHLPTYTHPYTYPPKPTYPPLHPSTPTHPHPAPTYPPLHLPTYTHTHLHLPTYTYPPTPTSIHPYPPTPTPTPTPTHPYTYPPTPTPTWLGRGRWMQGWVGRCRGGCKWVDVGVGKWVG